MSHQPANHPLKIFNIPSLEVKDDFEEVIFCV